jgi:hypothetical protein
MKKIILLLMMLISFTSFSQGPEFEIYTGITNPKPENTTLGYMVGLNVTPNLFQIDKHNPKKSREYLNKFLLGIEFSGYQTKPQTTIIEDTQSEYTYSDCNCTTTPIDGITTVGKYITKQDVLAVSLNFGVELYKGWFVLSGISSYQHRNILNNETLDKYRTTYLDFGLKKYIKVGRSYWSPTIKFNSEVISFGLGYSFYK